MVVKWACEVKGEAVAWQNRGRQNRQTRKVRRVTFVPSAQTLSRVPGLVGPNIKFKFHATSTLTSHFLIESD